MVLEKDTMKGITIKSIELVDIINEFRKLESNSNKKEYKELKHKTFIEKIRKEIEVLKSVGLEAEQNILPSKYKDSTGRSLPCFELNRDGMLQMLNSESALVRYKTIEYINKLENQLDNPIEKYLDMSEEDRAIAYFQKIKETKKLEKENKEIQLQMKKDKPLVELAKKRLDKDGLISITDATKTFELKRGRITKWGKSEGYIHKTKTEVNQKGDIYFRVYDSAGFKCIGVTEDGLTLINDNLEKIK
nr:Rha family transcriptional regulator [Clostridium sp. ZBS18]